MSNLSASALQPQSVTILSNGESRTATASQPAEKKGFGFGDFIDMINPLHHIPVVGQVYRAVTGDQISDKARLAGGGLFAGPLGIGIAAGTIAMRKDGQGQAVPDDAAQMASNTVTVPIDDGLSAYNKIAAKHWTRDNLSALSASLQSDMGQELKSETPEPKERNSQPAAAPVAQVTAAPLTAANSQQNAQVWTQMLSNLEKYEAMSAAPR